MTTIASSKTASSKTASDKSASQPPLASLTRTVAPNVNTYHWDTVYVADYKVLDAAIKNDGSYPKTFDYTDSATKIHIAGTWSDWALAIGGSGSLIHMTATVATGTASGMNEQADLSQTMLTIQFELEQVLDGAAKFVDPTAKASIGKPKVQQFPTKANPSNTGGTQTITVVGHTYPNLDPAKAPFLNDILATIFQNYFNAHLGDFKAVFHVMMINEKADKDTFQWLKPSAVNYAVDAPTTGQTLTNSAFGVLAMTQNRQPGPLQEQAVDIAALVGLPEGANSAFVISAANVVENMLLKGAISTIQGSKAEDFSIDDSGLNIVNANEVTWGNFKTKDGVISPRIKPGDFLMRLDGNYVHLEINNASYSPLPGITVYMNLEQNFSFGTVKRKDGKFVFVPDVKSFGNPTIHANVEVSEGLKIAEIVIAAVGAIAAIAGGISFVASAIADAATTAVTTATDAVIDITADSIEDIADSLSDEQWDALNEESASETDDGIDDPDNPDQVQNGSIFKSTQFRAYCGLTAAIAGFAASGIAVAGPLVSLNYDKIPAFDDFAANVLGASQFPVLQNYELKGASFRSSLVCGIKLT